MQTEQAKQSVKQCTTATGRELKPNVRCMISADELRRRPTRPADYAAENQALIALAQELANSPEGILQKLAETALSLCRAHSAGLSLLEEADGKSKFHWRAIAGQWAPHLNGGTPRNFGPCGTVLDQDAAMICSHPEVDFAYWEPVRPVLEEALLVPFHIEAEAVGTIWVVAHDTSRSFDAEDLRVMTSLGAFAATAYQTLLNLNAVQRAASIVECSHDAIFGEDLNGTIISWNRGAERMFGYMAEEVIGKPIPFLIPPDCHNEENAILERLRRGERIGSYETVRRRKDGSPVDISFTVSPLKNRVGKVIGVSKIARNITERLYADRALRESEARLQAAVDLVGLSVYSCDLSAGTIDWNDRAKAIWGLPPEAEVDLALARSAIHPADLPHLDASIARAKDPQGEGTFHAEFRVIGINDGLERWVSSYGKTTFVDGKARGLVGALREITQEKHAEVRLRASEARLKAAVDLVKLGRYAWNPQTNELQWDDTLRAMWGLAAGAHVDYEVWRASVHPDDLARVDAAVQRCTDPRGDGVYEIEYRVIGKTDGVERWIATRGQTNFENNVPVSFFGVALEVTNRKHIERRLETRVEHRTRELAEANRELRSQTEKRKIAEAEVQQLQRLDAIGQITSGVAHDFNNLLSVVLTNARLLSRTVQRPDEQEGIDLILTAADRGAKLIAQLLAFSGQQRLEPREVDLNSKLAGMVNLLSVTLGGTVQLKTTFAPDLWPALIDPNQIEMIVLNLAINAKDAMTPGGTLTIETFNTVIESEPVRPEEPSPGDYVGLAVKDTGTGIPDHVLPLVFEPFFTTKEPGKGSGLGLAQVFGFAKQSGGGVRLETRLGQGTAVTIFLPRAWVDVSDCQADFVDASNCAQTMTGLRVLVVDDNKAVLKSTVRMLESLGFATASAESANEALRLLARNEEINIVLADFAMPEMSGGELAKAIRAVRPTLPVILMTGYSNLGELRDARIILKPFTENDLVDTIDAALR